MQLTVLGAGPNLMSLAMRELGRAIVLAGVLEVNRMTAQIDESVHPGERHRDNVKRVNSGRSRAGKAERWA